MTTNLKFADAIELTQQLVSQLPENQLSPAQITQLVQNLVATTEGARGFFVGYLTNDAAIVDQPSPAIIQGLQAHPAVVADLLVKNLAMSTAQHVHFQRSEQPDMASNSATVARRSRQLIALLDMPLIHQLGQQLSQSIQTKTGKYVEFLERWGYDPEQQAAIQQQMDSLAHQ
jgi:hypothetical protein